LQRLGTRRSRKPEEHMMEGKTWLLLQELQVATNANWKAKLNELEKHVSYKFYHEYFMPNWTGEPWEKAWRNQDRPGNREGIWNTNNGAEACFKEITASLLGAAA